MHLTEHIRAVLADGKPHRFAEVIWEVGRYVDPAEAARRCGRSLKSIDNNLDGAVAAGRAKIIRAAVADLVKAGAILRRGAVLRLRQHKPARPTPEQAKAQRWARGIRQRFLSASGDAGLELLGIAFSECEGEFDFPPCAWKVFVRFVREWHNRGVKTGRDYERIAELNGQVLDSSKGLREHTKAATAGRLARVEWVRQYAAEMKPSDVQEALLKNHDICVALQTVRNDISALRRQGRLT